MFCSFIHLFVYPCIKGIISFIYLLLLRFMNAVDLLFLILLLLVTEFFIVSVVFRLIPFTLDMMLK